MTRRLFFSLLFIVLASPMLVPQGNPRQPSATPHSGRQKSLLDFYTSSANSRKVNYGQAIEEWRKVAIANTFESFDFWVTVMALGLAGTLFLYALYLSQARRQTLLSAADLVAKYQNQLAASQRAFARLHEEYAKSLNAFEIEKEPKLSAKPQAQKPRSANEATEPSPQSNGSPQPDQSFVSMRQQIAVLTQQLEAERQKNRKLRGE